MQLSEHFSLAEMVLSQEASRKGIDNTPTPEIIAALTATCQQAEAVRGLLGVPMLVSSGYRSPALNAAIGGTINSAHCLGYAMDFICPAFGTPLDICRKIQAAGTRVDQCIQEGDWCHISFAPTYRQEFLTAKFDVSGKATYSQGLVT